MCGKDPKEILSFSKPSFLICKMKVTIVLVLQGPIGH